MSMSTCILPQPKTTSLAVVADLNKKNRKLNTPVSSRKVVHQPRTTAPSITTRTRKGWRRYRSRRTLTTFSRRHVFLLVPFEEKKPEVFTTCIHVGGLLGKILNLKLQQHAPPPTLTKETK